MRQPRGLASGVTVSPRVPGYLELTPELLDRIVVREPIEKYYDVEEEPFARGKSAAVRRCRERSSGTRYAAKVLRKRRKSPELRAEVVHEVAVLEACSGSQRVVSLHQVFESPTETVLILELACGGELQTVLDKDEVPVESQVIRLMRQILDGLVFLHSINVAHLDLKPQNLVLTGEFPNCDVKLCDFGISRYLSQGADVREILGTPDYVAPEVLNYEPISLATDMWSVGVLMYVLLTGCSPFGGDTKQETFCNITQCRLDFPEELFEDISQEAQDLMTKLMVTKPSERLSAKECLQHPWFSKEVEEVPGVCLTPVAGRRGRMPQGSVASTTETLLAGAITEENDNLPETTPPKLDNEETKLTRTDSLRSHTMPVATHNINKRPDPECLFKFKQIYITDDAEESPPPSISGSSSGTDAAFSSDSNSDTISDMSIDSSSDRSSIISLDDSLDYLLGKGLNNYRYYSCYNVWEATRNQRAWGRNARDCNGAFARAKSIFSGLSEPGREANVLRENKLAVFNSRGQRGRRSIALELQKELNSNIVTIKEVKPVSGRSYTRTSELKCETVQSRIRKLQVYSEKREPSKDINYDVF